MIATSGTRRTARIWRTGARQACAALLLTLCCGCPMTIGPDGRADLPFLDESSNATFDSATALPISHTEVLEFAGRIDYVGDLDLYSLGTLDAGDRVYVDVQATTSGLDLVAAIFDSRQYLHAYNDDREPDGSNLNPELDIILRGQNDTYYLGITPYFECTVTGTYRVTVRIERGGSVPPPATQIVYLDWDGGQNIAVKNVGVFNLAPFDAADLGPYAGRTEEMKDRIQVIVADRYAGYGLVVLNSDDHPVPTEPHTTVYFGGSHRQAFAISQHIDTMNEDPADRAIIFTESYRSAFGPAPTFEQMAQAVGNTVAHEVGHLLGLVHTADCEDLMDSSCGNQSILVPQRFKTAVLDASVFPVGYQAAREILEWILGFVGL